ncbi:terminase large subunit [Marinilabilia salmonicolor]|uniref:Phage terminase large subunit-like protein n=1 Tax=Marinilabilia salmonicolor TaxID=989 RepID=A0A368VI40_9BACT|nr:terminase TerL endonuclease subunit [Marinilabilia salmonicolor]RCW38671.1 phage terminase large subunit-like protein [Marinilabilia salmonicolor]
MKMMVSTKKQQREKEVNKYIDECIELAYQYERDVLGGNIVVNRWIKKAIKREQKLRKKYTYNEDKVRDVFKFFSFVNIERKKQFIPLAFQAWIVLAIYSLYRDNGLRLRKYAIIWMARKNGKTAFTSLLSLYELMKGAENAEVYFLATTSKQASQALSYLKSMVSVSPALKKRLDVLTYWIRYKGHSIARPLAAKADSLDGLNPSFAIIDESHAHANRDLFNIMDSGMKARKEPLLMEISTAGFRKDYPFYTQLELAKEVLEGKSEQDNTLYLLYTLDEEEEVEQPEMWVKSNPALGHLLELETLKEDFEKAKKTKADINSFIVKNLNFYKDSQISWIEDEMYKKCFRGFNVEELKGSKAYIGIDLAATRDLAALAVLIEKDGKFYSKVEHFLPQNDRQIVRMNGLDLSDWIEKGWITQTEKPTIDYDYIAQRIKYYSENFDVEALGYDKWNSSQLIPDLQLNLGLYCVQCPQNTAFFNLPLRFLEKFIVEQSIKLEKNPVLRWMFRNVVLYQDGNANIKVMKNKSNDSVDGVVALAMAMGMYLKDKQNNYELTE